jgi:hypothetical protein
MIRRNSLFFALLTLLLAAPLFSAPPDWSRDDAAHLLRRAGFGGTPEQIDQLHSLGRSVAVEYLLTGDLPAGATPIFHPANLPPFSTTPLPSDRKAANMAKRQEIQRFRAWWLDRMFRTDHPLEEKMTLFWHGLFCSGFKEIKSSEPLIRQNNLFHQFALGNYQKLTAAIVHDAAMLKYLNNDQNVRGKPNENLARELMELFTMGEGNGYTEQDIKEVARALTGAGVRPDGSYMFRPFRHDPGIKTIFGHTGAYKPDDVVDLIFAKPQPAQHLAQRLWTFFADPNPSPLDLAPIVESLHSTHYDVKAALRVLFNSPAFYADKCKFSLIKSPPEVIVGTLRTLGHEPNGAMLAPSIQAMDRMGMELFQPPNVKGWPGGEHWITSATLFTRYNTCSAMIEGNLGPAATPSRLFPTLNNPTPDQLVDAAIARFLHRPLPDDKRQVLIEELGKAPLRIGDPLPDRRIRQMLALLLSTPEYQVE